ncbi:restriction endonuclease [Streptomyces sp. NPDC056405]|uniref:restriction endonuclease n=1 Tax=Streptomyces sp. NPDC056405 TaxID=3345811 RepID=UPI0035E3AF01
MRRVGGSHDNGADALGVLPDGRSMVIQCKRYTPKSRIPSREVRDLLGARAHFKVDVAVFVTTTYFSGPAEKFATENGLGQGPAAPGTPEGDVRIEGEDGQKTRVWASTQWSGTGAWRRYPGAHVYCPCSRSFRPVPDRHVPCRWCTVRSLQLGGGATVRRHVRPADRGH